MDPLSHRPCGACRELVSSESGCPHWKPGARTGKRVGWVKGRVRKAPAADSAAVAMAFLQVLDRGVSRPVE